MNTNTEKSKPHILFVDDEKNVLDGIRRNCRPLRQQYEMLFAESGAEALEILSRIPVDIVVSDMRMPVMDGATLLREVAKMRPETVRIILTGHSAEELILQAVPVTHRFLSKPCSCEELKQNIDRIMLFRNTLENQDLSKFLCGIERLPVMPMPFQELQKEIDSPNPSVNRIAELVSQSPALATRMLQLANSAFFGQRHVLTCPKEATLYLGLETASALAVHLHLFDSLEHNPPVATQFLSDLQTRSANASNIAHHIALEISNSQEIAKEAFVGGLLSNIGKLALSLSPNLAESAYAGTSHTKVGAYLLALWGLPANIVSLVACHHCPSESTAPRQEAVAAVHIAQSLLDLISEPSRPPIMDWAFIGKNGLLFHLPEWLRYALDCNGTKPDGLEPLLVVPMDEKVWKSNE